MKERPILFSGEMVRAILAGRKTQTRRVIKYPICTNKEIYADAGLTWYGNFGLRKPCKFGEVGDRLWVKETFAIFGTKPVYRASCQRDSKENNDWWISDGMIWQDMKWKPSIFMPRWASRIILEIVDTRIERLQEISVSDALTEGVMCDGKFSTEKDIPYPVATYKSLWDSINGPGSWDANPFVWVIEFKQVGSTETTEGIKA